MFLQGFITATRGNLSADSECVHVLPMTIFGMLRIHSQLNHVRVSRGNTQRPKRRKNECGEETASHVTDFFVAIHHFSAKQA